MKNDKKQLIKRIVVIAAVVVIACVYLRTVRNGGDTSELTQVLVDAIVDTDENGAGITADTDETGAGTDTAGNDTNTSGNNTDTAGSDTVTPGNGTNTSGNNTNTSGSDTDTAGTVYITYTFRNDKLLSQHYEKHGIDMGFSSKEAYEAAASDVINNPAALHKTEKEDGDYVYYIEATNEFVILSTDGYIRTYFLPDAGISYYNRQ